MFAGMMRVKLWCGIAVALAMCFAPLLDAEAKPKDGEPVPRIMLVGDSWPWFLVTGFVFWQYDNGSAFRDILPELGYGQWSDRGITALAGSMLTQWSSNELTVTPYGLIGKLDFIREELLAYPTMDIVHLCLGGNDYMRGDFREYIDYIEFQWQTLVFHGDPAGGTYTLTFEGQTTAAIAYGAAASEVQSALEALGTIGAGNIEVIDATGVPTYFCSFQGVFEETPVPMMTADGSGLTGDGDEDITAHGVRFDHGWKDTWGTESPAELAFAEALAEQMQIVVEAALDTRPDVRLLLCDYDYMDEGVGGADPIEANTALASSGLVKYEVMQRVVAKPEYANRCFYLNTFGLMQWTFGYPCDFELTSVAPNEIRVQTTLPEDQYYGPMGTPGTMGTLPHPGVYPDYDPWAGGDLTYPGPAMAILFNFGKHEKAPDWAKDGGNIHLHRQGNHVFAEYCVEQYYGAWFDLPNVLFVERATPHPILPGQVLERGGLAQLAFEVTFTEPVTGVDPVDFTPVMGGGLAGASIVEVIESKDGATYTVVVDTGSGDGTLGLEIVDNGSITAVDDGSPLNGGVNGGFAWGEEYQIDRAMAVPVSAWPVAVVLLAAGAFVLRKRTRG